MSEKTNIEKNDRPDPILSRRKPGVIPFRAYRGGCWRDSEWWYLRVSSRLRGNASYRDYREGFRLVLQTKDKK